MGLAGLRQSLMRVWRSLFDLFSWVTAYVSIFRRVESDTKGSTIFDGIELTMYDRRLSPMTLNSYIRRLEECQSLDGGGHRDSDDSLKWVPHVSQRRCCCDSFPAPNGRILVKESLASRPSIWRSVADWLDLLSKIVYMSAMLS